MKEFRSENFNYRDKVDYHMMPVIEGRVTIVGYVGLYHDHDVLYFKDHGGNSDAIILPNRIPTKMGDILDMDFVHEMNDMNLHALACILSANLGKEGYNERIGKIKSELLEIQELETRLGNELPGYRGERLGKIL